MNDFLDTILSNNGVALAVSLIIFIITLWLIIKRFIGFVFTLILLCFALVSGFAVANADLVREIFKNIAGKSTPQEKETLEELKAQLYKSYEGIKTEFAEQKEAFSKILKRTKESEPLLPAPATTKELPPETAKNEAAKPEPAPSPLLSPLKSESQKE